MYLVKGSLILPLSFLLYILIIQSLCSNANNTLNRTQQLLVDQTLVSPGEIFEIGFVSLDSSSKRYLGMWHKKDLEQRLLWVANRDHPLAANDSTSSLKIGPDGNLRLEDGKQNIVWLTNVSVQSNNTVAVLQDDGNFILKDSASESTFWKSFDYPGDTLLPGMKVWINSKTGEKRYLSSWKAEDDPAPGQFVSGPTAQVPPQLFIWNGSIPYFRSGPWNGAEFLGTTFDGKRYANGINVIPDPSEGTVTLTYNAYNASYITIMKLTPSGATVFMSWNEQTNQWIGTWMGPDPNTPCDLYGTCGPFGVCNHTESLICQCLEGFVPKSDEEWRKGNWSRGCVRETSLICERNASNLDIKESENDTFLTVSKIKLPDNFAYIFDVANVEVCKQRCLSNCACVAYASPEKIGCLVWTGNLSDSQLLPNSEDTIFLRLAYPGKDIPGEGKRKIELIISFTTVSSIILLAIVICCICRWRAIQRGGRKGSDKDSVLGDKADVSKDTSQLQLSEHHILPTNSKELPMIDFATIVFSTDNFSEANKLGEGGFGPVYKGKIENGQLIAVKRLSRQSGQGIEEFKNETVLISKLQHRNLVRLLGCCIHGEEKLLVYEYMKNKSLDAFIFDSRKKLQLDWTKRVHIIQGIARGILYLHRDSSLRVIHRDLKASNVLLDDDMNPKISDFGLARTFRVTQELANTHRVVGTFGYMSPEYAIWGLFSEKSDVYSFGVLLLEIVSGRKNNGFLMEENYLSLLGSAWKSWDVQEGSDFLDQSLADSSSPSEVTRCIQIGLLCVQDHPAYRPTMFDVVLMLSSEKDIGQPKQPTFTLQSWLASTSNSSGNLLSLDSDNISLLEGR